MISVFLTNCMDNIIGTLTSFSNNSRLYRTDSNIDTIFFVNKQHYLCHQCCWNKLGLMSWTDQALHSYILLTGCVIWQLIPEIKLEIYRIAQLGL
jgi:hypothetical protein